MKLINKIAVLFGVCAAGLLATMHARAQCQGLDGFPLKTCEAGNERPAAIATSELDALRATSLETSAKDVFPAADLSTQNLHSAQPFTSLKRTNEGAYLLAPGEYEALVESFPLDPDPTLQLVTKGGFLAAPYKGLRSPALYEATKDAELHPELSHADLQQTLRYIAAGTTLDKMPVGVQQTAATLLSRDLLASLQPSVLQDAVVNNAKKEARWHFPFDPIPPIIRRTDKEYGISETTGKVLTQYPLPIARGTWTKMPGNFYVRYEPTPTRTKLQLIVPPEVQPYMAFDPPQFLAVFVGAGTERIAITLRPAR